MGQEMGNVQENLPLLTRRIHSCQYLGESPYSPNFQDKNRIHQLLPIFFVEDIMRGDRARNYVITNIADMNLMATVCSEVQADIFISNDPVLPLHFTTPML